jgi:hypothetical protein
MTTPRITAAQFQAMQPKRAPAPTTVLGRPVRGAVVGRDKRDAGVPEKVVQQNIIKALAMIGVECMVTSQRRAAGVTLGMPDLFAYVGRGCWLGIEVKRNALSRLSPEQERLRDEGKIVVVWSPEQALAAVKSAQVPAPGSR